MPRRKCGRKRVASESMRNAKAERREEGRVRQRTTELGNHAHSGQLARDLGLEIRVDAVRVSPTAGGSKRVGRDVVHDVVGAQRVAADAAGHVVEMEVVTSSPRDIVVGARRVARHSNGAKEQAVAVVQRETTAEHVHTSHTQTDQRVVRSAETQGGPLIRVRGVDRVANCRPNRLEPGMLLKYRLAVDKERAGRENALAVLAFWAEMTRDPGH